MKKMLFITSQLPYPPLSGGVIKSWKLVEFFSTQYELTVACPLKQDDGDHADDFKRALPNVVFISKEIDKPRSSINWLKSLLQGKTLNEYRSYDKTLAKQIDEAIQDSDAIFVDHYEVFQYCSKALNKPVILHTHNAEGQIWHRYATIVHHPLKRFLIKFEGKRIEKREVQYADKADLVFAAPNDIQYLQGKGKRDRFKPTYHLGNDSMLNLPDIVFDDTEESLLYVGTLTWEANVEGLLWFRETVWPELKSQFPNIVFHVIGKNPDQRLKEWANEDDSVRLHGFVEDLEPFYVKCRVMVVPLRFGSGMKVKILDAFYRGIPVVTTSIGAESLDIENGEHLLFSDDPDEFKKHTANLLNDSKKWNHVSGKARKLANEQYKWSDHLSQLQSQIAQLFHENSPKTS